MLSYRNFSPKGSGYFLLFTNLLFIVGILFFEWNGYGIVAAYFLETLLIGVLNIVKLGIISVAQPGSTPKKKRIFKDFKFKGLFGILFFIFHFGIFIFVQLIIFISAGNDMDPAFPYPERVFIPNFLLFFQLALPKDGGIFLACLLGSHILSFCMDFIYRKEYQSVTYERQMMLPYARVIVQQFVVILGGFILLIFRGGTGIAIFLILLKTLVDLYAHNRYLQKIVPVTKV
jgi:hypothetical protein